MNSCQVPFISTSVTNVGPNSASSGSVVAKLAQEERLDSGNVSPSTAESCKLLEYDTHYLKELTEEKEALAKNGKDNSHALRLLESEITRTSADGEGSRDRDGREQVIYFDIYRERPIRLTVRALVPTKEHPKFNFVGKLLGPKGNSMKRLQEHTMTKMAVLGRGSMRDRQKEEDLRASQDPKYQHLQEDLHVEITAFAPPAEAHARIAFALTEVRKYLIPDSNDEIRQEQMRELELISGDSIIDNLKASQTAAAAALLLSPSFANIGYSAGQPAGVPTTLVVNQNPLASNNNNIPSLAQQNVLQEEPPTEPAPAGNFKAPSSLDNSTLRKTTGPYSNVK